MSASHLNAADTFMSEQSECHETNVIAFTNVRRLRLHARHRVQIPVVASSGGTIFHAEIKDLSLTGAGVLVHRSIKPGELVELHFVGGLKINCHARWQKMGFCGLEFTEPFKSLQDLPSWPGPANTTRQEMFGLTEKAPDDANKLAAKLPKCTTVEAFHQHRMDIEARRVWIRARRSEIGGHGMFAGPERTAANEMAVRHQVLACHHLRDNEAGAQAVHGTPEGHVGHA